MEQNTELAAPGQQNLPAANAATAVEMSRAVEQVRGAIISAKHFPRNQREALDRILTACQRPGVASQAMYSYSKGGTAIEGASIRLMEVIATNWGNLDFGVIELSRKDGVSECLAYAHDLETNVRSIKQFQQRHWIDTKGGGRATRDQREEYELVANYGARRLRSCLMAVIPVDIREAAEEQCEETMKANVKIDADLFKKLLAAFEPHKVTKEMIEERIQRNLEAITSAQVVQLRKIITSLNDGMSSAKDWFKMPPPAPQKERLSKADMAQAKSELEYQKTTIDIIKENHPNLDPDQLAELAAVKVKE